MEHPQNSVREYNLSKPFSLTDSVSGPCIVLFKPYVQEKTPWLKYAHFDEGNYHELKEFVNQARQQNAKTLAFLGGSWKREHFAFNEIYKTKRT